MALSYDIIIIGGGPAGLSAATTIARQDHSTLVLDSQEYRSDSQYMHTLPTWDHQNPGKFRAAARKDLERYDCVKFEHGKVSRIAKVQEHGFEVDSKDGKRWNAKKIVLATGVVDVFPDIEGYADCWISGIFHCLFCHGYEVRGLPGSGLLAVDDISSAPVALHLARMNLQLSSSVTLYTNGNITLAQDISVLLQSTKSTAPMYVDARHITKLTKGHDKSDVLVHFEDGEHKIEGFLSHKPKTVLKDDLHKQLELEQTPNGMIKVNGLFNETSVKGVFVAGDICHFTQAVPTAIASGTAVGAGAPLQLQAEKWNQKPLFG